MSRTVAHAFLEGTDSRRDIVAVRWQDADGTWRSWTTGELADQVASAAAGLRELGVQAGDRVVLMLRNIAEFYVADLAVIFCGAIPVSIYNSSPPDQIVYLAGHAEAKVAIVEDAEFLSRFQAARDRLPELGCIVVVRETGGSAPNDVVSWRSLLDHEPIDLAEAAAAISPDTVATIIYTSGTTGPPKGVVLTHANVAAEAGDIRAQFGGVVGKRVVSYLPLAHIAERNVSYYGMVFSGLEVSCCPDPKLLEEYLRQVRPFVLFGVPRIWEKIRAGIVAAASADPVRAKTLADAIEAAKPIALACSWGTATEEQNAMWERFQGGGLRQIRAMVGIDQVEFGVTGAAPISSEVVEWFNALGVPLSEAYGLSETVGALTWTARCIKPGTVGPAVPSCELGIAEDGEVLCRGPLIFAGYFNDPEKTAEILDGDGWLHTGDIGRLDEDGYLTIVDRKKELIITAGGKNVSPANLEAALKSLPLVGQACAVGDAKPYVAALVVLDPEVAPVWARQQGIAFSSLAELADHPDVVAEIEHGVREAMRAFNQAEGVKRVCILGTEWLPDSDELTPTFKLKRRVIHQKYASDIESLYA